ncbi:MULTISPECIES: Tim44 domain-containing protein [unclassified Salinivibrio]|uniref:Tim44 domain-containing protein n=1 Tax=unclassified Salinivibrio TaxID=2636825 RepID=UPI00098749DC|nr:MULTISPECIES: TIM44-like domain-containing protein [unclassified Salinivibrio]OOF10520.1 preprotein translocase subunit Tim44 [Salinivibrio sp. PR919]OOF19495.1 preprotein translocase subunit Tim44 [Salinivibrio sp. PR932]
MKKLLSVAALMFVFVVSAPYAEAKRFGGGKSFGKSFKTAPAPKQKTTDTNTIKQSPTKSSSKKGLMGGLLGGLLAGGLLAAFFGGAFEGIQFMDILILGLIAYLIMKFLRGMTQAKASAQAQGPAYAGQNKGYYHEQPSAFRNNATDTSATSGGFGETQPDVPFNFPPQFDMQSFLSGAREHYRILQGAWNHNELEKIQEYVTPALYNDLAAERARLGGEQHTEVMYVDAEIVRADYDSRTAQLSLKFTGRYCDRVEGVEEDISDIWHLERDLTQSNAPWLIVGIQS